MGSGTVSRRKEHTTKKPRKLLPCNNSEKKKQSVFFAKICDFVTGERKFPKKVVRNCGFAGKHCKIHVNSASDEDDNEDTKAFIQYWNTAVVSLNSSDSITIDMGNWRTRSTAVAINIFLSLLGVNLRMVRRKWKYQLVKTRSNGKEVVVASFGQEKEETDTPKVVYSLKTNRTKIIKV